MGRGFGGSTRVNKLAFFFRISGSIFKEKHKNVVFFVLNIVV